MEQRRYTIDELAEKTGYSRRTIRYYVQEGLIEPPAGRGRGGFYNDTHLNTLLRIKDHQAKGLSLGAIVGLVKSEAPAETTTARQVWARYEVCDGVEIHVRRDIEDREPRKLLDLLRVARSIMKEDKDAGA